VKFLHLLRCTSSLNESCGCKLGVLGVISREKNGRKCGGHKSGDCKLGGRLYMCSFHIEMLNEIHHNLRTMAVNTANTSVNKNIL
jgi:hypothetical protein